MRNKIIYLLCLVVLMAGMIAVSAVHAEQAMKFAGEELLPPNAKAGECYARLFVPPTYKTVSEMAMKKEAAERLFIKEPQFEFVEERVMTRAASERLEIILAEYEWIEEEVLVYPEHVHYEAVPARYETATERVLDQPAHTVWKKGKGPIQKFDYATGEIMCLVDVPATYKTITKRVLAEPATTREIVNPAKYKTVKKKIMKTPPTTRKIDIPEEFTTVKVRKLTAPAQIERVAIPEEFQTVSRREMLTEGRMEWRPVLCETNVSPNIIYSLQRALKDAGFNPGSIDGSLGRETMSAIQAYQKDKGLPAGELTLETLKSLKIDF